ncbi:MAG TPA: hypothetical protein VM694_11405 [Polyangium sp.]|nr:hypothetical protein [Polyangium sp.]
MSTEGESTEAPEAPRAAPPARPEPPTSSGALAFVRPLAAFGVLAMLLGRAFGPSLRGLVVGLGRTGDLLELAGAAMSYFFLILAIVGVLALGLSALQARLPAVVRFGAVFASGLVVLVALLGAVSRVPDPSLVLVGGVACALALLAAWDTMRTPFARATAAMLGLLGLGGLARVASVLLVMRGGTASESLARIARGVSTVGLLLDGAAMAVAVGVVASRGKKLTSPATLAALGVALFATRAALAGTSDEAAAVSVLLARAAKNLILRPEPLAWPVVATFVAFAAPAIAVAALATRTLTPALSGAIALLLVARGAPDVPLCALALVLASLATVLASRDHRGLWAAITRVESTPEEGPGASGEAKGARPS